ncbi:MAG TPA: hypothetical protein VK878_15570 [Candidatus Deferrimicrobiaceae bacterium]|nr:hypothetical protein [Candidatus Deferrimicrobiaceae bacterium]
MRGRTLRGLGLAVMTLVAVAGCAALGSDEDFPPPVPPAAATHFKVTSPGGFPYDAYLSAWGEGYVIHVAGRAPIYLISDKNGGFIIQSPGEAASFVTPRKDGNGWSILSGSEPATFLFKQDAGTWVLQPPGGLPTLIVPQ